MVTRAMAPFTASPQQSSNQLGVKTHMKRIDSSWGSHDNQTGSMAQVAPLHNPSISKLHSDPGKMQMQPKPSPAKQPEKFPGRYNMCATLGGVAICRNRKIATGRRRSKKKEHDFLEKRDFWSRHHSLFWKTMEKTIKKDKAWSNGKPDSGSGSRLRVGKVLAPYTPARRHEPDKDWPCSYVSPLLVENQGSRSSGKAKEGCKNYYYKQTGLKPKLDGGVMFSRDRGVGRERENQKGPEPKAGNERRGETFRGSKGLSPNTKGAKIGNGGAKAESPSSLSETLRGSSILTSFPTHSLTYEKRNPRAFPLPQGCATTPSQNWPPRRHLLPASTSPSTADTTGTMAGHGDTAFPLPHSFPTPTITASNRATTPPSPTRLDVAGDPIATTPLLLSHSPFFFSDGIDDANPLTAAERPPAYLTIVDLTDSPSKGKDCLAMIWNFGLLIQEVRPKLWVEWVCDLVRDRGNDDTNGVLCDGFSGWLVVVVIDCGFCFDCRLCNNDGMLKGVVGSVKDKGLEDGFSLKSNGGVLMILGMQRWVTGETEKDESDKKKQQKKWTFILELSADSHLKPAMTITRVAMGEVSGLWRSFDDLENQRIRRSHTYLLELRLHWSWSAPVKMEMASPGMDDDSLSSVLSPGMNGGSLFFSVAFLSPIVSLHPPLGCLLFLGLSEIDADDSKDENENENASVAPILSMLMMNYGNWALGANVETGLMGQCRNWAYGPDETGLMDQCRNWAYGPINWAYGPIWKLGLWATVETGLMGQAKLGLWAKRNWAYGPIWKLGLWARVETELMGQCRNWAYGPSETGLMGQYGNWADGPIWKLG
ncbi:hypothetical protein V8G54_018872 [Vigna mungo]|uniref:Uncharacterized protein n=1 Tax=Vigna mungo TaxID=3915 RepID=A0AAQ3NAZ2_VIGMU